MPFFYETMRESSPPAKHLFSSSRVCLVWPGILCQVKSKKLGSSLGRNYLVYLLFYFIFFFGPRRAACRILVPRWGIEPAPPAVEVWSLNHWATREVPEDDFLVTLKWALNLDKSKPDFLNGKNCLICQRQGLKRNRVCHPAAMVIYHGI